MCNLNFRPFFIGFCLLLFTGCAVSPDPIATTPYASNPNWQLRGKLAMILPDERVSANLNWRHQGRNGKDQLRLTTPLGTTVMAMNSEPGRAEIDYDGKEYIGHSAESLIQRLTGWRLPLTQLSQYLLGNLDNARGAESVEYDPQQRPHKLILRHPVSGERWQLEYQGWQQQSGYSVPRRIELRHQNQRIKLALSHWQPEL